MRSHVTSTTDTNDSNIIKFQYRKWYEVTCDDTLL